MWPIVMIIAVLACIVIAMACKIIHPYEKGAVERLGKYQTTVEPGLSLVWPFIQTLRRVDMREKVIDVPPQEVITKDNVCVNVDAVVYFQITDPRKVLYNVENFHLATLKLAQTNLRNVVGDLELDDTLTSREKINVGLREVLDDATDTWGVRITRVEIQRIEPPRDITDSMSQQMKAERERRAAITEAEGVKASAITRAEGARQAAILSAEGEAESVRLRAVAERDKRIAEAEGEAAGIASVFNAIHESRATDDVLAVKYLETLSKLGDGRATKIFMPVETSGILSGIAALGDMFKEDTAEEQPRLSGERAAGDVSIDA